ncbi:DUF7144 family membrane protein [Cryptosporangium minutisporangium]|uniref:DUF7144 domain-containing protein n=1 Tax=Cryptosporangium minutisporangium TaxID=113569 RepID=A0ABP6SRE6_9ACTN
MPDPTEDRGPAAPRPLGDISPDLFPVPAWLRPRVGLLLGHRIGQVLAHTAGELLRVQIFDRSMTLAAQAFTSVFPLLLMLGALFGQRLRAALSDTVHLPAATQELFRDALGQSGLSSFGVAGCVIVLLSTTGLARALTRAYAAVWEVTGTPHGVRALWRWLATVLTLALLMVGTRVIGAVTEGFWFPRVSSGAALFLADCALTILVPRVLLAGRVPLRKLVAGGVIYGLLMLALRPAGGLYLPRTLRVSEERYGTIGLAFTYIGWLYVLSFALLLTAVLGRVLDEDLARLAARVQTRLTVARRSSTAGVHPPRMARRSSLGATMHPDSARVPTLSSKEIGMSETQQPQVAPTAPPTSPERSRATAWVGMIFFASIMLVIVGTFQIIQGLAALINDEYYLVTQDGLLISLDYTVWGWIHLIIGCVAIAAAVGILLGKPWAQAIAVLIAAVSIVANITFLAAYPVWSTIAIALDVLVIYALTVHGREVKY